MEQRAAKSDSRDSNLHLLLWPQAYTEHMASSSDTVHINIKQCGNPTRPHLMPLHPEETLLHCLWQVLVTVLRVRAADPSPHSAVSLTPDSNLFFLWLLFHLSVQSANLVSFTVVPRRSRLPPQGYRKHNGDQREAEGEKRRRGARRRIQGFIVNKVPGSVRGLGEKNSSQQNEASCCGLALKT